MLPSWDDSTFDSFENLPHTTHSVKNNAYVQHLGIAQTNSKEFINRPHQSVTSNKPKIPDARIKSIPDVDLEIKASQEATQHIIDKKLIQQQEFNELNCKQWMDNISEKLSTLASATSNIQKRMHMESDIDAKVTL